MVALVICTCKTRPSRFKRGPSFILDIVIPDAGRSRLKKGNLTRPNALRAKVLRMCGTETDDYDSPGDIVFLLCPDGFNNSRIRRRQLREPVGRIFAFGAGKCLDLPRFNLQRARAAPAVITSPAFRYAAHVPAPASPLLAPLHPGSDGRVSYRRYLPAWRPFRVTGQMLR
jgi:hypothetical protein